MDTTDAPLKHQALINQMTLEEKASLLSGANFWNTKAIERLDVPSIMLTDGPHGLRKQGGKSDHLGLNASIPATCFPTAATLASSWDASLLERVGAAIGEEAKAEDVSVVLGPGLNLVRNPLGGRTFEYFSEDPYVSGKLAAGLTRGIQSTGVAASPKHFAVNSQEHLRMTMNEVVDERTLHELYLEGFRRVVEEAHPRVIMSSYNQVNGVFANESRELLDAILVKKWGFDGVVVTDWGGEHDRVAGLTAGNHLEMPSSGGITDAEVVAAVKEGDVAPFLLDARVNDLLELAFSTHEALQEGAKDPRHAEHHKLAIQAAERSMVLLRNEGRTLPLKRNQTVAVIGDFARTPRYQGAGSSLINPTQIDNAYDALIDAGVSVAGYAKGFHRFGRKSRRLQREAVALAQSADVALIFLGLDESSEAEGLDREHIRLPQNQLELIAALFEAGVRPVVVLAGGGPVELPFADSTAAILHGQLGGQGGGTAVTRILTGAVNPSGKLAVSYPLLYSDVPSANYFPGQEVTAEHREGLYVGYRYYDTADVAVRYPFGHGLSYTSFEYSDVQASQHEASITITNTGDRAGEETVQVYVRPLDAPTFRPKQELKAFTKVVLEVGESKTIVIEFDARTFAYYDIEQHDWVVASGAYEVAIGASSRDIREVRTVSIEGVSVSKSAVNPILEPYYTGAVQNVSDEAFTALVGRALPAARWDRSQPLTELDTIRQLQYSNWIGRNCYGFLMLARKFLLKLGRPLQANNLLFVIDMPFYKLERFSAGKTSLKRVRRFLGWVNR
ncbi:glycoside hydrolase family 3 C-terminal domain-containing protein [Candidatus Saccharibacteria bacterium TM7i]|nr:glycoside hydrolase family 3 C-terminal domain-containing protein [Candidatus Saccharibacteria bacterium TM7i]